MKFGKILTIGIGESALDKEHWKRLDALAEERISLSEHSEEIKKHLADAECLLVKLNPVTTEYINDAPHLKYIGALATAYGRINSTSAKNMGIVVTNVPGYATESVAEFVFAVVLEHMREIERGKKQGSEGNYSESGFSATEIKGKKFGILGMGKIGGRVAEIALGFGADVMYWSKNRKKEFEAKGINYEDVDSLVSKADIISLHFAQTEDTKGFLGESRIAKIKKGAIIVNTTSMESVNIDVLEDRLRKNDITFILDYSDEISSENLKRLLKYKNCIIYPPIAYISDEGKIAKQDIFISNMEKFLEGNNQNRVN
ncbi:MAG: hypothetical protein KGH77_04375 [Candidatus Micrarchaeota archaeon]|nr:hypothetical protein [Candidatus Micrarchaeota archaeon]MDE1864632.1 hypothetical protein [Candidatus Micrarchaeota archaeon]